MSWWHAVRWVALVAIALVVTVGLARLFSGPEDTWIRDASGQWAAHGHPAGPPPGADYQRPWSERFLPAFFLAAFGAGLLAAFLLPARSPAGPESLRRGLQLLRAISVISLVLAGGLALALPLSLVSGLWMAPERPEGFDLMSAVVLLGLAGLTGFLALLGAVAHAAKKVLEAHYDLKRQMALLQETIDQWPRARLDSE
jgi:hypothetical protein